MYILPINNWIDNPIWNIFEFNFKFKNFCINQKTQMQSHKEKLVLNKIESRTNNNTQHRVYELVREYTQRNKYKHKRSVRSARCDSQPVL